jgi:hypothetical protein
VAGCQEAEHQFGGVEFRFGKRELGHLHEGINLADLPFTVKIREQLVQEGKASPHHIFPNTGWVSYRVRDDSAVPGAIELFRLSYEGAAAAQEKQM